MDDTTQRQDQADDRTEQQASMDSGMDPRMHTARGRAETTSVPPAVPDGTIPGIDEHGAEADEARGGAASDAARQGAAKAFPESSDSQYLDPDGPASER